MIFYGINPLVESLRSPCIPEKIWVQSGRDNPRVQKIIHLAETRGIPIQRINNLSTICNSDYHQGIGASISDLDQLKLTAATDLSDRVLMLDSIQDPHNFGAAMRVCDAFGFRDIIYHSGNSSGITPAAIKVSTGAVFHLRLLKSNLNNAIRQLQDKDYRILALEADGNIDIFQADYHGRICLVIGSEDKGIRFNIKRQADSLLRIPMAGKVNSLNVSCALSAVLSEISRQDRSRA